MRIPNAENARKGDTYKEESARKLMTYVMISTLLRTSASHALLDTV